MAMWTSQERLYLTSDRRRVVREGDPDSAFLLVPEGGQITEDDAKRFGLMPGDPAPGGPSVVPLVQMISPTPAITRANEAEARRQQLESMGRSEGQPATPILTPSDATVTRTAQTTEPVAAPAPVVPEPAPDVASSTDTGPVDADVIDAAASNIEPPADAPPADSGATTDTEGGLSAPADVTTTTTRKGKASG